MLTSALKRLAGRLPRRHQQELKRLHFWRQIRRGVFTTAEDHDREFERLHLWVKRGDWVLDIGANVGNYTARLSQLVGETGRVIAFEPIPDTFELLAANLSRYPLRNVTLLSLAVSDTGGLGGMTIPRLDTGLENPYMAHLTRTDAQFGVLCLPIDSLRLAEPIRLVKIDVEGHELPALRGMQELLRRDHPLLIVEGQSADVASYLAPMGYAFEDAAGSPNRVFRCA